MGAGAIVRERQNQTLERLLSNGVRRDAVIVGKFLAAIYKGLLQTSGLVDIWNIRVPDRLGPSSRSCNPDLVARGPSLRPALESC